MYLYFYFDGLEGEKHELSLCQILARSQFINVSEISLIKHLKIKFN